MKLSLTSSLAALALVVAAACGGGGAPATNEPIGNADPTPAPTVGVAAIDTAAFTAMLADAAAWDAVLDPAAGVTDMHYVASAIDDAQTQKWVKRLCGDEARAAVAAMAKAVQARIGQDPDYAPECSATETGGVTCFQRGLAEYDLIYGFDFVKNAAGAFVLGGVTTTDVGTNTESLDVEYQKVRGEPAGC